MSGGFDRLGCVTTAVNAWAIFKPALRRLCLVIAKQWGFLIIDDLAQRGGFAGCFL